MLDAGAWARFPRAPRTPLGHKGLLLAQMEEDGKGTLHQLMLNESQFAWILRRLKVTRPIVRAVLDELREARAAQINFASILADAGFKNASRGGLVPAKRPNARGNAFNYLHLPKRHTLEHLGKPGVERTEFMIITARSAAPTHPGRVGQLGPKFAAPGRA